MALARSALGELDVEVVLRRVLESGRELTGARYAALGVLDDAKQELARFIIVGIDEHTVRQIGPRPKGRGVLGELILHPEPIRLDNVGADSRSYGFPWPHPPMRSFLGVPIVIDDEPFGNLYLTEKDGGETFTEEDETAAVMLADLAAVAVDHARRYSASEAQRVQLQQTVDTLGAMIEIGRALAGETEMATILELVAKRGRALVSARQLLIEIQQGEEILFAAGAGDLRPDLIGKRVPIEDTVASQALRTRRTQRLSDELNWSRFQLHGVGSFDIGAQGGVVVPMTFRGEAYGVIVALDPLEGGTSFSAEQERLLESFATSAAMAVVTARSAADVRRRQVMAAAEAERGRWARELHDETLQALASVRLSLAAARRRGDPEGMVGAMDSAIHQLQTDMDSLRALITDLRPGALDQLGTEAALGDVVDRHRRNGLEVDLQVDLAYEQGREPTRHTPELEAAMYRTVQEALNNAVRHGGATRAVVELIEEGQAIHLSVRDNGSGFDPAQRTAGFGLLGMRERAEMLEGKLEITSGGRRGTSIIATYPVRRQAAASSRERLGPADGPEGRSDVTES
jgi:signal transduction histidine kinase